MWVDNAPLRAAFLASGLSARELAERAGLFQRERHPYPHTQAVERALGLRERSNGKIQGKVTEKTALLLGEQLSLDPIDLGL